MIKMDETVKIKVAARQLSFAEAEEADDKFWANASEEERWWELMVEMDGIWYKQQQAFKKL